MIWQQRGHFGADRAAADVVRRGRLARGRQADDEHAVACCACQAFAQRLRIPLGDAGMMMVRCFIASTRFGPEPVRAASRSAVGVDEGTGGCRLERR